MKPYLSPTPPKMKRYFCLIALLAHAAINAQNTVSTAVDAPNNSPFWSASFKDGGEYQVRLATISSISKHEYIANSSVRVREITIATNSSVVTRIYHMEPVVLQAAAPIASAVQTVKDAAKTVSDAIAPQALDLKVIKDYPQSTHAHTVEYVVQSAELLDLIYQSLNGALHSQRGRNWSE